MTESTIASMRRLGAVPADTEAKTVPKILKATAYINQAQVKMANQEVAEIFVDWFGNNDATPTREEILAVFNSVKSKMKSIHIEYPGAVCPGPAGLAAYV